MWHRLTTWRRSRVAAEVNNIVPDAGKLGN